jgi:hypothetical protein
LMFVTPVNSVVPANAGATCWNVSPAANTLTT